MGAIKNPIQVDTGELTRQRLLEAAERLFARHGYAATSVRRITREASCNVASVNYHFNGKHNLYREVFIRRVAALREQRIAGIRRAMDEAGSRATLELVLQTFSSAFLEPLVERSDGRLLVELMTREMLDPQMSPDFFLAELIRPVHDVLAEAIRAVEPGIDQGKVRLSIHSFIAQLIHVVQIQRLDPSVKEEQEFAYPLAEMVSHIVRFTAGGIRTFAEGTQRKA